MMSERSFVTYTGGTEQQRNCVILRQAMERKGRPLRLSGRVVALRL